MVVEDIGVVVVVVVVALVAVDCCEYAAHKMRSHNHSNHLLLPSPARHLLSVASLMVCFFSSSRGLSNPLSVAQNAWSGVLLATT